MAGVFEIVGFIASVLELARFLRDLISRICDQCSDSFGERSGCFQFVKFLNLLEKILNRYMNLPRGENSLMRDIVEAVKCELDEAWKLVSASLDTKGWRWPWSPRKFPEKLKQLEERILRFLNLIPMAAGNTAVQDEHEYSGNECLDLAITLSLSQKEQRKANSRGGRAIQASLDIGSPPRSNQSPIYPSTFGYPTRYKICAGCSKEIRYGSFLNGMGAVWHPQCFYCHACGKPISEHKIPTNRAGLIEDRAHPFGQQRYCPWHEHDNTPQWAGLIEDRAHPFGQQRYCPWHEYDNTPQWAGLIEDRAHPFGQQRYCPWHEHDNTPQCCSRERMEVTRLSTSRECGLRPLVIGSSSSASREKQTALSTPPPSTSTSRGKGKAVAFSHKRGKINQGTPSAQATTPSTSGGHGLPPIAPTSRSSTSSAQQTALPTPRTSTSTSRGKGKGKGKAMAFSDKRDKGNQ